MSKYVDGFVILLPKDKIGEYREIAETAGAIWRDHGALEYYECIGDDLEIKDIIDRRCRTCDRSRTMMIIQVNTDNHINGSDELTEDVKSTVESHLQYLSDRISRVEVHISDENSHKGGENDIRCAMEARIQGHQPTAVTHASAALDDAVDGAAEKLKHVLETIFGKLDDR